ncbi:MAG: hypothetical protein ACJAY7_001590 [Pseudohongiellaceae bacterium]|jgi:hypothetical protein
MKFIGIKKAGTDTQGEPTKGFSEGNFESNRRGEKPADWTL